MGITRGQLRKLGFKDKKDSLVYNIKNSNNYLYLGKGKTVIFYIISNEDESNAKGIPLVHLQYTTAGEMLDYLRNTAKGAYMQLKDQIGIISA